MLKLFITLQVAALTALTALAGLGDRISTPISTRITGRRDDERGSVTIEQVIWAGAAIMIVGIVVAAFKAFVTSEAAKIR